MSRRGSYYDNYDTRNNNDTANDDSGDDEDNHNRAMMVRFEGDQYDRLRNEMLGYERASNPTQTISLLTTVPQNIANLDIAGKHAPTRQSLRHSRMIVMNKNNSGVGFNNGTQSRGKKMIAICYSKQINFSRN